MRPSETLARHKEAILAVFAQYPLIKNPRVFGSVVQGTDTAESDIDFLVEPERGFTYFDMAALKNDLESVLNCSVDIATTRSLPEKWRGEVLLTAREI